MKKKSLQDLQGGSLEEKCAGLGITKGKEVDIRILKKLAENYLVKIILYWEEDRAKVADYEKDLEEFRLVPEENRPFIKINAFLKFISEMYAMFPKSLDDLLEDIPIHVTIMEIKEGKTEPIIYGLMPFRDEMDV